MIRALFVLCICYIHLFGVAVELIKQMKMVEPTKVKWQKLNDSTH